MNQLRHTFANCPPYLLLVGTVAVTVAGGLWRLYVALQGLGLGN